MDAQTRSHFKMNSEMTGILIYNINQHSDALNILKKYDVILSIDGVAIENDGTGTTHTHIYIYLICSIFIDVITEFILTCCSYYTKQRKDKVG